MSARVTVHYLHKGTRFAHPVLRSRRTGEVRFPGNNDNCPECTKPMANWTDEEIDAYLRIYGKGMHDK